MRFAAHVMLIVVIALATGIGSAWWATGKSRLFGTLDIGGWQAWVVAGTLDADPYTRANIARTGQVPLGAAEGLAFTAQRDAAGDRLDGRCRYRVVGDTPPARLWTLSAVDANGRLTPNPTARLFISSRDIVRDENGRIDVRVSRTVEPGNWLPLGTEGPFALILRFYDTPVASANVLGTMVMPAIEREGCS
jgi:hypothetical protein